MLRIVTVPCHFPIPVPNWQTEAVSASSGIEQAKPAEEGPGKSQADKNFQDVISYQPCNPSVWHWEGGSWAEVNPCSLGTKLMFPGWDMSACFCSTPEGTAVKHALLACFSSTCQRLRSCEGQPHCSFSALFLSLAWALQEQIGGVCWRVTPYSGHLNSKLMDRSRHSLNLFSCLCSVFLPNRNTIQDHESIHQ